MKKQSKITLVSVGKLKKEQWRAAQDDYLKRLLRYTTLTLTEVKDYVGKGSPDTVAIEKEGKALIDASKDARFRVALSIRGRQMDSLDFAATLQQWYETYGTVAFLIGGPLGLSRDVLKTCHYELSLSRLTLPHELARILLLEQLYRATTIINKHQYHK